VVIQTLQRLELQADIPRASLYVWFTVPGGRPSPTGLPGGRPSPTGLPGGQISIDFAARMLERAHVSLTPGSVFGSGGEGYIRLSLTAPLERVEEAMLRLEKHFVSIL